MHIIANDAVQQSDKINLHEAETGSLVEFQQFLSWDAKAINLMGCFVFKFLEFLGFLLLEPSQRITELASSMEALKENQVSLVGSVLEPILDKLNNLIKLTLQVTEYISELNLLPETEYNKSDLLSSNVYWAILSVMACYIQITLLMENGKVAMELSPLISNLSDILKDLKGQHENCKQKIEEMEALRQDGISHFEDAFNNNSSRNVRANGEIYVL
ncbi:hypothetical protein L6164_013068 [Bauhinia variegata]|uniref:Uncharacterized protein n=1 Tax=Bauhinia variegata TaxID=167791 RepID=A0ACB9PDF7_BAUVA|nr:hypothetical protein L6164_013068 [Bauhinia variegata]